MSNDISKSFSIHLLIFQYDNFLVSGAINRLNKNLFIFLVVVLESAK